MWWLNKWDVVAQQVGCGGSTSGMWWLNKEMWWLNKWDVVAQQGDVVANYSKWYLVA
jgi:hypothetical protein